MGMRVGSTGVLVACVLLASCGNGERGQVDIGADVAESVRVTSPVLSDGRPLPVRFTCDGDGAAPPLAWAGAPVRPGAWAVVVDDPDAPGGTYVHWVVLDLPPAVHELSGGAVPAGAVQPATSAGEPGYAPACPPDGEHRYRFTVYALDAPTGIPADTGLDEALAAVASHAQARGVLVTTYQRP